MRRDVLKTKSIRTIEQKMEALEPGSLRYQVLEGAKNFKASWIALGQILYTVYKDKLFKSWGYMSFESYCRGELGLQKQTATKLLYSYYFLEKNEPQFLKSVQSQDAVSPKDIPSVDAVNVLRLAANRKELSEEDYQDFKKSVFEEGKDAKEVRKEVGLRLRSLQEEEDPQKVRHARRQKTLQRFVMMLKGLQKEVVSTRLVSDRTAAELDRLLECLQKELAD